MLKENLKFDGQDDLFCARLEAIIDMKNKLVKLSPLVKWESLADDLSSLSVFLRRRIFPTSSASRAVFLEYF
ncbi:MAG: hypothetical protein KAS59_03575 [Alphaproteobacteria bacterium]|nr:hypothetical protein [Alphaproteobacteria bacterium]